MAENVEYDDKERSVAYFTFLAVITYISILGYFLFTSGVTTDNLFVQIFLVYSVLCLVLPLATVLDVLGNKGFLKSLLFNPDRSLIRRHLERNPKNQTLQTLDRINSNPILSLLFWLTFFSIPMFYGALINPETAVGEFFGNYVFPVEPQSVFDVIDQDLLFVLFPGLSETGWIVFLVSILNSIIDSIILKFASGLISSIVSLILIGGVFSGYIWKRIHDLVSVGKEIKQTGHTVFGAETGILTVITGSWLAPLSLHLINLFFWQLRDQLTANEFLRTGLFWVVTIVLVGIFLFMVFFNKDKKGRKRISIKKVTVKPRKNKLELPKLSNSQFFIIPLIFLAGFILYTYNKIIGITIILSGLAYALILIRKIVKGKKRKRR